MVKHASSHGFAVLVCTIASSFIVEILKPRVPHFMVLVQEYSERVVVAFNIPMSTEGLSIIFIASILALIWGVFFKLRSKGA